MLASKSSTGLGPIYAGRVLAGGLKMFIIRCIELTFAPSPGLGIGAASNLTPLYISEIA